MTEAPENAGGKQGDTRWKAGQSGNPAGKAKGTKHRLTLMAEALMLREAQAVVKAIIAAAKAGDMTAARLILDRIAPARRDRTVTVDLPKIETTSDLVSALGAVAEAIGAGTLTPSEGAQLAAVLETKRRALETTELADRIEALEKQGAKR